ncbi:putative diphthamide synthesis protein-domain-containing protein [Suillus paluster]|uniref:putative diphthamide synthesis protein-domain-containing protein n=1 Tax=Suillus paluster TaxID=48578 RepID=UPI001B882011|nr:putative diphthamide synthesis protein-domain-containing protein [Suillus paluster]KAG1753798.1 putative diphthamide synthesis protein-domain-containing protein [Suillus paluster]
MAEQSQSKKTNTAAKPRKRFVGSKSAAPPKTGSPATIANQIPDEILSDALLNQAIKQLPANYSFEIHKTVHHARKNKAKTVALQMPEGLQMFACAIADIIECFTDALTVIMGDVTYGACCVDDYTAVALGCDMLVHYGHSCLVPIDQTTIKTLYIFVEIGIDSSHLAETIRLNFPNDRQTFHKQLLEHEEDIARIPAGQKVGKTRHLQIEGPSSEGGAEPPASVQLTRFALVSTIQFVAALQRLKEDLTSPHSDAETSSHGLLLSAEPESSLGDVSKSSSGHRLWTGVYDTTIPRSKPLSPGEILGCTAPLLGDIDALIYLGDGRFHLESIMIANPSVPAFRYDPYSKKLTRELYNHEEMRTVRDDAVQKARKSITAFSQTSDSQGIVAPTDQSPIWGIILGTLGRQGSFKQMQAITHQLSTSKTNIPYIPILLSELSPAKLALFNPYISTFVQTSCPRLSIDWGYAFDKPLLSPYETAVAVGQAKGWMNEEKAGRDRAKGGRYPMDFYEVGSPWAVARTKSTYL